METEKFNSVLSFFKENNIELPTDVKNSIEDVFRENDLVDSVECYFADEIETFQKDLTILNSIKIDLDGSSEGFTNAIWTYYGSLEISYSESIGLIKDGQVDHEISEEISTDILTDISDPAEFQVILLQTTEWDTKKSNEKTQKHLLKIYCPYYEDGRKVSE